MNMNDILEFRIKKKLDELNKLVDLYCSLMLEDDSDKFAEEMYIKYYEEKRLLEKILKGE